MATVLAGGQGRRMGGLDKGLLPLGARTVLDELLSRISGQVWAVAINARRPTTRFGRFALPVIADEAGEGPLAGVLAGLGWAEQAQAEALLTVPCDTPFVPATLAADLWPAPSVAADASGTHHAVALWPVTARTALADWTRRGGSRRVSDFAASLGMRAVHFDGDAFFNINTPDDLLSARGRAAG